MFAYYGRVRTQTGKFSRPGQDLLQEGWRISQGPRRAISENEINERRWHLGYKALHFPSPENMARHGGIKLDGLVAQAE